MAVKYVGLLYNSHEKLRDCQDSKVLLINKSKQQVYLHLSFKYLQVAMHDDFHVEYGKSGGSSRYHGTSFVASWLVTWSFGPNGRLCRFIPRE